jgi:hypothetical protein
MRKLWALSFLSLAMTMPLRADFRSTWPFDGHIGFINSNIPGRTVEDNIKSSGGDLGLHFSPILGWDTSRWLILPELDIDTNSANTILKVDDERFVFLSQSTSNLELGTAFRRTPDQRFGFKLFGGGFQGKETVDETLQTGQYNYQDGGVQLDWRQKWDTSTPFRSTLGLRGTNRQYPNWQTLDPSARKEKDQAITKLYTDLEWAWNSMPASTVVGLSLQSVDYVAAYILGPDSLTSTTKRKDSIVDLSLGLPMEFGKHGLELKARLESWTSNLNNYDSQNNYTTEKYIDFGEVGGGFGYSYDFKGPWSFFDSPQLTVDLDLAQRVYVQRLPRNTDGSLDHKADGTVKTDVKEADFTRNISLGFNSAYTEHWAFYVKFNNLYASSNNDDHSSALYNYIFNTFNFGFNFVY